MSLANRCQRSTQDGIPALKMLAHAWLVTALNRHNVTVTQALTHPSFHLLDRQRLKHWQAKLYAEINGVAELLIPQPKPESAKA